MNKIAEEEFFLARDKFLLDVNEGDLPIPLQ